MTMQDAKFDDLDYFFNALDTLADSIKEHGTNEESEIYYQERGADLFDKIYYIWSTLSQEEKNLYSKRSDYLLHGEN